MRSLVEQGLRKLLAERAEAPPVTTLRDATFTGNGMNQEFVNAQGDAFAELIYELPRLNEPRGVDHRQRSHRTEDPRRADRGALCLDHGVDEMWSSDRDFSRFRRRGSQSTGESTPQESVAPSGGVGAPLNGGDRPADVA